MPVANKLDHGFEETSDSTFNAYEKSAVFPVCELARYAPKIFHSVIGPKNLKLS